MLAKVAVEIVDNNVEEMAVVVVENIHEAVSLKEIKYLMIWKKRIYINFEFKKYKLTIDFAKRCQRSNI